MMRQTLALVAFGAMTTVAVLESEAKPLVWWRFNERAVGERTDRPGQATVKNYAPGYEDKYWGKMYTNKGGGDTAGAGIGQLVTDGAYNNLYADAFPTGVKLYDPLTGKFYDNDRSVYFDGDKAVGSRTGFGENSAIVLEDPDGELELQTFTVEMFVKCDDDVNGGCWRTFVSRNHTASAKLVSWGLRAAGNLNQANCSYCGTVGDGDPASLGGAACNFVYTDKKWHHLAWVVDGATGTSKVYVDYKNVATTTMKVGDVTADKILYVSGQPIIFGSYPTASYGQARCWMDEVRICDTALTPEQFLSFTPGPADYYSLGCTTDDDTVAYLPFADVCDGSLGAWYGATWLTPSLNFARGVNAVSTSIGGNGTKEFGVFGEGPILRRGVTDGSSLADASAYHFKTNNPEDEMMSGYIAIPDPDLRIVSGGNFTVEGVFKWMPGACGGRPDNAYHYFMGEHATNGQYFVVYLYSDGKMHINFRKSTEHKSSELPLVDANWNPRFDDTAWHHVAFVYDHDNWMATLYVDYRPFRRATQVRIDQNCGYAYGNNLYVGTAYGNSYYMMNEGYIDAVRVTKRALCPQEFLTHSAVTTRTELFWADFEDGAMGALPYRKETQGWARNFASGGVLPVAIDTIWGRGGILPGGTEPLRPNTKCLQLNGGQVEWGRDLLLENVDELTVEFATRVDSAADYAGLMRLSNSYTVGDPIFLVSVAGGKPFYRVDTVEKYNQGGTFDLPLVGTGWHMLAFTFRKNGENTDISLYDNRKLIGTKTVLGHLKPVTTVSHLSIGASTTSGATINGYMDEIRISRGVLEPAQMMMKYNTGLMLLLK